MMGGESRDRLVVQGFSFDAGYCDLATQFLELKHTKLTNNMCVRVLAESTSCRVI